MALGTMFGRFELLDRIGLGGMAEVWRARVAGVGGFEKILVVKKILPAFAQNKTFIDMLLTEARLCAVLQHTNIVQTYENGEIEGQYYIAMEYVAGPDLFKILSRATQVQQLIPTEVCLYIASEVAKGLHYAHNAKDHYGRSLHIIHRDVSPSNVIVSEGGEVKIMDFGVARGTSPGGQQPEQATRSGVLKGKLGYMSPEQVTGQPFDHRSDIFSLGIVLYESMTLKRLFLAKTDLETLVNIRDARMEHKFKKHSYIDEGVRNILRRSLSRDLNERYPTAMAMHDDIVKMLFEQKIPVSNSALSTFIASLFDPMHKWPRTPPPVAVAPQPITQPQRVISAAPVALPSQGTGAAAGYLQGSHSLSFSPEDMKKIRDKIAERRMELSNGDSDGGDPVSEAVMRPISASTRPLIDQAVQEVLRARLMEGAGPNSLTVPSSLGQAPGITGTISLGATQPIHPNVIQLSEPPRDQGVRGTAETVEGDGELAAALAANDRQSAVGFDGSRPEPVSYTVASPAKNTPPPSFRLRTGDGQEFGPLAKSNLEAMLRARTATVDDFVSVNDGPFQTIRSVPALQPAVLAASVGPGVATTQGVLNQWSFLGLLCRLYADRATGCLELRRGDAVKSIYFRRGRTQYIASNQHAELLGSFMVVNGFISQADVDMAMARARSTGGRLGDLLIGLNLIKPFQLYQVLERQLRAKFIDAFGWDNGQYAFYEGTAPPGDIVPLDIDPVTVLAEGVRERVPLSVLEPIFANKLDRPLYRAHNPLISVGSLKLQARESKALSTLLAAATPQVAYEECYNNRPQRLALLHVLFLMLQTGLLTFEPENT